MTRRMTPVPKPSPSPKSPRRTLKRSGRIKPKKRTAGEFKRIYGSKARVEFVKSLPCAACGVVGYSENAHVLGNGGLSRKGGCVGIAPLCTTRMNQSGRNLTITYGCHGTFDNHRWMFDKGFPDFNPETAAANCEAAWQEYQKENTK